MNSSIETEKWKDAEALYVFPFRCPRVFAMFSEINPPNSITASNDIVVTKKERKVEKR